MQLLVDKLPQLQEINLRGCDRVGNAAVMHLCTGLKELQMLNLEHCHLVTAASLPVLSAAPKLQ